MLSNLINSITKLIENIVLTFGAPGISLIAFFENLFPPTPSELLYPLAGKMASDGRISLAAVIFAGISGSLVGSLFYYALGHRLGEEGTREVIQRFGTIHVLKLKISLVTVEDYDRGLRLFRRYGVIIVFIARLMPLVHGVVSIPAGVIRMNIFLFCIYTSLGAMLWITPLATFGYWLGNNWQSVLEWMDLYENILLALMLGVLLLYIGRRVRQALNNRRMKPTA